MPELQENEYPPSMAPPAIEETVGTIGELIKVQ
jgi:hypothetical protein